MMNMLGICQFGLIDIDGGCDQCINLPISSIKLFPFLLFSSLLNSLLMFFYLLSSLINGNGLQSVYAVIKLF